MPHALIGTGPERSPRGMGWRLTSGGDCGRLAGFGNHHEATGNAQQFRWGLERVRRLPEAGVEVESKISEWMFPQHYLSGKHTSGTVGTFGSIVAAAWLLGLKGREFCHGFGTAASWSV